jgi:hypothetical protein
MYTIMNNQYNCCKHLWLKIWIKCCYISVILFEYKLYLQWIHGFNFCLIHGSFQRKICWKLIQLPILPGNAEREQDEQTDPQIKQKKAAPVQTIEEDATWTSGPTRCRVGQVYDSQSSTLSGHWIFLHEPQLHEY